MKVLMLAYILIIVVGIYMIVAAARMRKSGEPGSMLVADEEVAKVKDKAGFAAALSGRELAFGVILIAIGAFGLAAKLLIGLRALDYVAMGALVASFVWLEYALSRVKGKFL